MAELGELRDHYDEIVARGARLVAVSVDPPVVSEKIRQRLGFEITFVSDTEGVLMDAYNIRDRGGAPPGKQGDLFLPTTFLLDSEGVIRWVYRPETYRVRASPAEVLAAIDAVQRAPASREGTVAGPGDR